MTFCSKNFRFYNFFCQFSHVSNTVSYESAILRKSQKKQVYGGFLSQQKSKAKFIEVNRYLFLSQNRKPDNAQKKLSFCVVGEFFHISKKKDSPHCLLFQKRGEINLLSYLF